MILCDDNCVPCCDFCLHAINDEWDENGGHYVGGPIGCALHNDAEHQEIADWNGKCDDFHCIRAVCDTCFWRNMCSGTLQDMCQADHYSRYMPQFKKTVIEDDGGTE